MLLQIKKIFKKYLAVLFTLRKAKLIWKKPKQADVLIFDRGFDTDVLFEYIDESKSETLCIRGEEINIPVFLLSTFSIDRYIDVYIIVIRVCIRDIWFHIILFTYITKWIKNCKQFYVIK